MLPFSYRSRWIKWCRSALLFSSFSTAGLLTVSPAIAQEAPYYAQSESYFDAPAQLHQISFESQDSSELDMVLRRLRETELRLESLEKDQSARISDDGDLDIHSASYQAGKKDAKDGDKKKDAPKEKKWFENYSLRGYAQFRYNYITHTAPGSDVPQYAGDGSIGPDQEFLIRRARLIFTGNISDHLRVYLQPDFASTPDGSTGSIMFAQIRDWYGDVFLDKEQVHRFRVGQSKVPYGWENLQSSQNRLYLDRNDAFNSAVRNERDLGIFYYWTPEWATDLYKILVDENLKGSGNYGLFGIGVYNGEGGSFRELNDNLHFVARLTWPWVTDNGQVYEVGVQGYTGQYVVRGTNISRLGVGAALPVLGTQTGNIVPEGTVDKRLGWTFIKYPQPFGVQAEWTIGEGPALNAAQSAIETRSLWGGYVGANYKLDTHCWGTIFPYARYQAFQGGYKSANNSPYSTISECDMGIEWQIRKEVELVTEYVFTDRTNLNSVNAANTRSYGQFEGQVLRFQLQVNY